MLLFPLLSLCTCHYTHEYRVTSTYMFPYIENLCRFDFEVLPEDENMCDFTKLVGFGTGSQMEVPSIGVASTSTHNVE